MKITRLETIFLRPRWHFLKIHTDEGLVGYGEPIVEGRARTVATAVHEMEPYLLGKDPTHIEEHWQALYRGTFYRGGPVLTSALSGVDQALWDITGKSLGVPVYRLLGGPVRSRIRVYAHVAGESIEDLEAAARAKIDEGFTALKLVLPGPVRGVDTLAHLEMCERRVGAVRSVMPKSTDLAVDCHGRYSPAMAIRVAKVLEPLGIMFLEEPCLPENVDTMVTVARSTTIPVATGERLFTRWGFREVLEKQAAAVLQPDLCHCGGISEARRIAAAAETYYASVAPHNPLGPISLAACIQLDAAIPNFLCQEQVSLGEGYLKRPFGLRDGYIDLPEAPGLGIELDDEAISRQTYAGDWDTPKWSFPDDSSFGDW